MKKHQCAKCATNAAHHSALAHQFNEHATAVAANPLKANPQQSAQPALANQPIVVYMPIIRLY
jgi:hypothetical protein